MQVWLANFAPVGFPQQTLWGVFSSKEKAIEYLVTVRKLTVEEIKLFNIVEWWVDPGIESKAE